MAFGVSWQNSTGKIAISSDYYGMAFLGNATFTGTTKPDAYTQFGGGGFGGYIAGAKDPFYVYTITSNYPPVAFVQLLANRFRVCSIQNTTGTTWEIVVAGNNWSTTPIIKCFARLYGGGALSGFGLRVWDAAGVRTWDTTEKMLVCKQRIDWTASNNTTTTALQESVALTGFTAPYVMSLKEARISATYNSGTAPNVTVTEYIMGFSGSAGTVTRQTNGIKCDAYSNDAFTGNSNVLVADRMYVIEGNNY
jgi:hypothetical protein